LKERLGGSQPFSFILQLIKIIRRERIMATFTAQILIGSKHTYDSGMINISHCLYLSENSRPAWILSSTDVFNDQDQKQPNITWIPTLENMLEDALLMIGIYVLKDSTLIALAKKYFKNTNQNFIELYQDIESDNLQELYKKARIMESNHKIIVSVFQGSSLMRQLPVLKNYQNDMEVCQSIYVKEYSLWNNQFEERGEF
jgi:hypothetical protein